MSKQKPKPKNDGKLKNSDTPLADYGERFLAYVIDAALVNTLASPFTAFVANTVADSDAGRALTQLTLSIMLLLTYHCVIPLVWEGSTIGKRVANIRIMRVDGTPLTLNTLFLRNVLGYALSGAILSLGYIWIFVDDNNQGWHDQIADTIVVKRGAGKQEPKKR